jgi:hypothetical protein
VLHELLELEVDEVVGQQGRWNPDRTAVRQGHEDGEVTLGGRRVQVKRPRMRTADGASEVTLETYEHFADRDQLGRLALERILAGVSTRKYRHVQEPTALAPRWRESGRRRSRRCRGRSWRALGRRCGI